jgi:hypothetical protein
MNCSVCDCQAFEAQKWKPNKCSACFHFISEHGVGSNSEVTMMNFKKLVQLITFLPRLVARTRLLLIFLYLRSQNPFKIKLTLPREVSSLQQLQKIVLIYVLNLNVPVVLLPLKLQMLSIPQPKIKQLQFNKTLALQILLYSRILQQVIRLKN